MSVKWSLAIVLLGVWVLMGPILIIGSKNVVSFLVIRVVLVWGMPMFQYESYSEKGFQVHFQDGTSTTEISHFSTPTEIVLRQNNHGDK